MSAGDRGAGWSAADFVALILPPPPEKLTPHAFRDAIARTLTSQVKPDDLIRSNHPIPPAAA